MILQSLVELCRIMASDAKRPVPTTSQPASQDEQQMVFMGGLSVLLPTGLWDVINSATILAIERLQP
jgi:hypothetical protein